MRKKISALLCVTAMQLCITACNSGNANQVSSNNSQSQGQSQSQSTSTAKETETVSEQKEPVSITFWYRNNVGEQQYTSKVEDKLNEILAKTKGYEHITIDLHPCKDYATDFSLAQATDTQIDLVSTPGLQTNTEIQNGSFQIIEDFIAANPEVTADLPDWFIDYGKVNGKLYYIPNYQQVLNEYYYVVPTKWMEASSYSKEEVQRAIYEKNFDKISSFFDDLVSSARKVSGLDTKYLGGSILSYPYLWIQDSQLILALKPNHFFYWDNKEKAVKFNGMEENWKKAYEKQAEMVTKGYALKTQEKGVFDKGMAADYSLVVKSIQGYGTVQMVEEEKNKNPDSVAKDGELTVFGLHDHIELPMKNAAGGVAVSSTSKNGEDAVKIMALLFNSKYEEFYNTLCWGLEGTHYDVVSKGRIKTKEFDGPQGGADTTYSFWKWTGGNTFNAWNNQSLTDEAEDYILNVINEGKDNVVHELSGIFWDTASIQNEVTQMKAVVDEYGDALDDGVKGEEWKAYYDEYMTKLEKAGLSKALEELNAQAKKFLENK